MTMYGAKKRIEKQKTIIFKMNAVLLTFFSKTQFNKKKVVIKKKMFFKKTDEGDK